MPPPCPMTPCCVPPCTFAIYAGDFIGNHFNHGVITANYYKAFGVLSRTLVITYTGSDPDPVFPWPVAPEEYVTATAVSSGNSNVFPRRPAVPNTFICARAVTPAGALITTSDLYITYHFPDGTTSPEVAGHYQPPQVKFCFTITPTNNYDSFTIRADAPGHPDAVAQTLSVPAEPRCPEGRLAVTGRVKHPCTTAPLPGCKVDLYRSTTLVATTTTGSDGRFWFSDRTATIYTLKYNADLKFRCAASTSAAFAGGTLPTMWGLVADRGDFTPVPAAGYHCCAGVDFLIPTTLYLTDSFGTVAIASCFGAASSHGSYGGATSGGTGDLYVGYTLALDGSGSLLKVQWDIGNTDTDCTPWLGGTRTSGNIPRIASNIGPGGTLLLYCPLCTFSITSTTTPPFAATGSCTGAFNMPSITITE